MTAKGEPLLDDWQTAFIGHFWGFGLGDFERRLEWVRSKDSDDRFVALSRCVRLYVEADRPSAWLTPLRAAVADDEKLKADLTARLNPKPSPGMERLEAEQRPRWFALWADTDPSAAIPALEDLLEGLAPGDASAFAQQFIVGLLGHRHGTATRVGAYRNARDLKGLYVRVHRYIRVAQDLDRANKGVSSPTLRDDAQDARNTLFNMLFEVPGAEAYAAIKALEKEHPEPNYWRWMAVRARQRAPQEADEPV